MLRIGPCYLSLQSPIAVMRIPPALIPDYEVLPGFKTVNRPESHYVQVYQYQVELEGGRRFGPQFNHREEAEAYMAKLDEPVINGRKKYIASFTDYITSNQIGKVQMEVVNGE